MDHTRTRSDPPDSFDPRDGDLRALFARTAPEVTPTDLDALFARAAERRSPSTLIPSRRRLAMMIRITAATTIAAAAALMLFLPRETAGFDFAEVERQVTNTKTVTLTQSDFVNGKATSTIKLLVSGPSLARAEFDGGYSVTDYKVKKSMMVDAKNKRVTVWEGVAFQVPEQLNFYALIRDIAKNPTKTLPERKVDGKAAIGFVVSVSGHEGTVWVDRVTKLPIRFEGGEKVGKDEVTQVMSEIVFDRPLDAALFRMSPPEGYKVETFGVSTLAPESSERAVAAPLVTPLVGIGPARFGMTREEITQVLGKPDREFQQGKTTYLSYYSRGFELWILPQDHPRHGFFHVSCLGQHGFAIKIREFQGKTDKGIGLGASRAEIIKAYGAPDHEIASRLKDVFGKDTPNAEELTGQTQVYYNKLQMSFTLFKDKVYQIWIDAPRPAPAATK